MAWKIGKLEKGKTALVVGKAGEWELKDFLLLDHK